MALRLLLRSRYPNEFYGRSLNSASANDYRNPSRFLERSYIRGLVRSRRTDLVSTIVEYFPHPDTYTLCSTVTGLLSHHPDQCMDWFLLMNRTVPVQAAHPAFPGAVTNALSFHPGQTFACRKVAGLTKSPLTRLMANSIMRCLSYEGDVDACREWLQEMQRLGFRPDAITYSHVIRAYGLNNYLQECRRYLSLANAHDRSHWRLRVAHNQMLLALLRYGHVHEAEQLTIDMKRRQIGLDATSLNILVIGLARWNGGDMFLQLWNDRLRLLHDQSESLSPRLLGALSKYFIASDGSTLPLFNATSYRVPVPWLVLLQFATLLSDRGKYVAMIAEELRSRGIQPTQECQLIIDGKDQRFQPAPIAIMSRLNNLLLSSESSKIDRHSINYI